MQRIKKVNELKSSKAGTMALQKVKNGKTGITRDVCWKRTNVKQGFGMYRICKNPNK